MTTRYVKSDTADFDVEYVNKRSNKKTYKRIELLWGDQVRVIGNGRKAAEAKIKARGRTGYVARDDLGKEALLEVYFIDVGQGDGVLICTPDRRHVMIDGGWPRKSQPTGKNAADFVDWKFVKDYGKRNIDLDAMICSHNDQDHYGGLWDLLSDEEDAQDELDAKSVRVENFYHAGLSWWTINGKRSLGTPVDTDQGKFYTTLIDSRSSVIKGLKANAKPRLQGEWRDFLQVATKAKKKSGAPTPFARISSANGYLPGFSPDDGKASIRVLAPVEFAIDGAPAIRNYGATASKNTNGNSLLFRLDYGSARILLTGDLNTKSMQALLKDWAGDRQEFECDVAKACHHGSDDVSYEFLRAMRPAVTVISSGDNEGHDHPRPSVVAASAITGYPKVKSDKLVSPLVYSTELARSVKLGDPTELTVPATPSGEKRTITGANLSKARVKARVTMAGDRAPRTVSRNLGSSHIVTGMIYGLVNVRTNGRRILCATMNEKDHSWVIHELQSRF